MLDQVEALVTLHEVGTMAAAATRLRLTPSAVSKRVKALEARMGLSLVEPAGRGLRFTPAGEAVVAEVAPLLAQLRAAVKPDLGQRPLELGSSPALLGSWLPAALRLATARCPGLELRLHARRGPVSVERVGAGAYDLAVCVDPGLPEGLEVEALGVEPMVVVGSGPLPATGPLEVWTIESASLTWAAIERALARRAPELKVVGRNESFSVLVQLARAGFGASLVPVGVARALGVPEAEWRSTPVGRPIGVVGRAGTLRQPRVAAFVGALREAFPFAGRSA